MTSSDSCASTALTMNPPIASGIVTPAAALTSIAAPGVAQAVSTGRRYQTLRPMLVRPVPTQIDQIHEVTCAGVAPSACAAWKTTTIELVTPTSIATKPATTADSDRSRRKLRTETSPFRTCSPS